MFNLGVITLFNLTKTKGEITLDSTRGIVAEEILSKQFDWLLHKIHN